MNHGVVYVVLLSVGVVFALRGYETTGNYLIGVAGGVALANII